MPFLTGIFTGLASLLGGMLTQFLISLGVGVVTYVGVKALVDAAKDQVISQLSALPASMIQMLAVCKVDVMVTIIFSALVTRLTLKGMSAAGKFTQFKVSKGG